MHGEDILIFVLLMVGITTVGRLINTFIKAKYGYPLGGKREGRQDGHPDDQRKIELLSSENGRQADQITRLEDRLRVLERIATDPANHTAREIEALR